MWTLACVWSLANRCISLFLLKIKCKITWQVDNVASLYNSNSVFSSINKHRSFKHSVKAGFSYNCSIDLCHTVSFLWEDGEVQCKTLNDINWFTFSFWFYRQKSHMHHRNHFCSTVSFKVILVVALLKLEDVELWKTDFEM